MKRIFAILTFISIILLSSCQVTENIIISDGENTSESDIIVYDFFIDVLNDFSAFVSDESQDESIMDAAVRGFADGLASNPDNCNIIYTKGSGNEYKLSFDFKSISNALSALNGAEGNSVLKEGENSLSFYLDINNYVELKEMIPFLADPNFEVYGPEYNQGMSEADYLDMIYYLLGEEAPDAISSSMIDINITTPGEIVSSEGVTVTGSNTCTYSFPLIDFLLLSEPMAFSISWN